MATVGVKGLKYKTCVSEKIIFILCTWPESPDTLLWPEWTVCTSQSSC